MSLFDKAIDSVKSVNPVEGLGDNLLSQLSPVLGDSKGLNILNDMRNVSSALPKEFPSIDDIFGKNFPAADSILKSPQSLVPGADSVLSNLGQSFPQIANFAGGESLDRIFGSDPVKGLLGDKQGINSLFQGLPELSDIARNPIGSIESVTNVFVGDKAAGGLLGAVSGSEGGLGGLLGSVLGGEGGIGSLLSNLGPIIEQILPLLAKIAPLALAII